MALQRGGVRAATGGAAGRGGGGGTRTMGGGMWGGPTQEFTPVPKERRARTLRHIVGFFRPYRIQVVVVLVAILATSLIGLVNPPAPGCPARRGHHRRAVREAEPVRRADDRPADRDGTDRRRPELPQQRHRPERHAGPARRAVRAPPGHAAAVLHRDPNRRDPESTRERCRRRAGGGDRHGKLDHEQPGDRDQHGRRHVPPELGTRAPFARPAAVLPVPDLPCRQGPARGLERVPRSRWPS